MVVFPGHVRIIPFADLVEGPLPEVEDVGEDVRLAHQAEGVGVALAAGLLAVLAGVFECPAEAALHLVPVVDHALDGHLVRRVLHRDAAGAGIDAAGVFPDHHVVDVIGTLVLERGLDAGIEAHRAQVDVLVEGKAQLQEDPLLEDPRLDVGVSDRAEQDRLVLLEILQATVGQNLTGALVAFAAEVIFGLVQGEAELGRGGIQDFEGLDGHFGPGSVTGEDCDIIGLHDR